ncbi:glycerophosphodiester phosphodiesterase [Haloplanus aerogenes]|uniref:Glycerophosphodiester phosphodiesterase n=1 Tax=Haloplanus aerogenes TaxID=660522 RepID=A0A3M0DTY2_9EURY|nr:glycerophosphodiester phosphodiesterase [Haloplanus aerogenes]AZH24242.1 glycerophosphodiester phosphodiesterase [Haloplanus aerogenes]RMB24130.1 glycerophosphoryl diester phosphodiesterase [Haloplanus aerogenes]
MTDADLVVIAHRGFAGVNPENTVGAVRAAASRADRVELDAVACADGTPIVFHDARLDSGPESRGITDGTGTVADHPPETVTAATVRGSGERVPTLDRLVAETAVPLDVELKRPGTSVRRGSLPAAERTAARERWQPFVDRVLDELGDRDVRFSSFCEGALAAVRERDSSVPLAPLCRNLDVGRELAARYDADAIHPSLAAVRAGDVPTDRTVNVWTIRTWHEARDAVASGADGLIADYPGLTRWL